MEIVIVAVFGAIIGSFINVCIYRMPRELSVVRPGSFCPHCKQPVRFFDNIPILSYLILGGKCRTCKAAISPRYAIVETLTATLFVLLYVTTGLTADLPIYMLFFALLVVISFVDLDFQIIPDILSLGGVVVGFLLSFFRPAFGFLDSLYGILLGGGLLFAIAYGYQFVTKREGMGGGDIKLLGMIGAFCGIKGVLFSLFAGSLIGALVGIPLMLFQRKGMTYAIPFGPFLSGAALVYVLVGERIIQAFLGFLIGVSA
jgi:leader peptidase (prepilin peptidase) / N-methyltransferase